MSLLVTLVSGFASGVFLRSLFVFGWPVICFVLLLATILFLVPRLLAVYSLAPFERESSSFLMGLGALFFFLVALGMLRATVADSPLPQTFASEIRHKVSYEGVVVSDPDVRDANQRFEVRVSNDTESTRILVVASRNTAISVGDQVHVSGVLLTPQPFASDGGRTFRYDKYLQRDGVRFIFNFASVYVTQHAPWYSLPAALARVKHAFIGGLQATLPEPYSSLAGGVVIGGKTGLGTDLQDAFVRSGLVQIIVLSGYNVMVVAEWIMAALAYIKISRRWSSAAGAIAILLFIGVAGFSATAIRAALMAMIALYARATSRTYVAGRALFLVVLLMLIWNPLYLVFDPGFGLSVAATAGLIWLAPILEILFERKAQQFRRVCLVQQRETLVEIAAPSAKNSFWRNAVATTLAAQIAVLPLLLYDTGNLSLVAVPANLITMPIVPLAMGLSALAGFAGILFSSLAPMAGIVIAYPAYLANAYLILIAQKAAELPLAAFTLPLFPFVLVLVAYAALLFIASSKRFSTTDQLRLAKNASI